MKSSFLKSAITIFIILTISGCKKKKEDESVVDVPACDYSTVASGMDASLVLGQANFTSSSANRGLSSADANSMNSPQGLYTDGTHLLVADFSNNRVVAYSSFPTANGQAAEYVIGQPNLNTNSAHTGGVSASSMGVARGVAFSGSQLFIGDGTAPRNLVFNVFPSTSSVAADFVMGQASLTASGAQSTSTSSTAGVYQHFFVTGSKLIVSDPMDHRVLIYNLPIVSNNPVASLVLGQASFTTNGYASGSSGMNRPSASWSDGNKLVVADRRNNRLLIWNTFPTVNNQAPDLVLGQADFTANSANRGGSAAANTLNEPHGVISDGTSIFVSDTYNNRILVWNSWPTVNGQAADKVIGQANFTSISANRGGSAAANTLSRPIDVILKSNSCNIIVADDNNHRVLMY